MGSLSTFGTFTMARLGIYVSQHALNTTGNNISNINTKGYSRQELDQSSMYFGSADRYQSRFDIRGNGGVLATGVNQLRDQYLDIRYRNEMTKVGESEYKLGGLNELGKIFDEVARGEDGEGVLEARFNDFIQMLENMHQPENANKQDADAIVRSAAEALVVQFNDYAKQLETLKKTKTAEFQQELKGVNTTLEKIRDLNESIRRSEIFGGSALAQKDERNLLIDQLSEMVGINVVYEMESLGDGMEVEKLKITTSGDPSRALIDGIYGAQFTLRDQENFGLNLSVLRDSHGNEDPVVLNSLTAESPDTVTVLGNGNNWDYSKTRVTRYNTEADAQAIADQLNANSAFTEEGSRTYWYHVGPAPDTTTDYVIHKHDVSTLMTDGKTLADYTDAELLAVSDANDQFWYTTITTVDQTELNDTELTGGLQAMRELLTESGEYSEAPTLDKDDLNYDEDASVKRGIPYYQKALDTLANTFAKMMNEANMMQDDEIYQTEGGVLKDTNGDGTGTYIPKFGFEKYFEKDEYGEYVVDPDDADGKRLKVKDEYKQYMGSPLFSNGNNSDKIGTSGDPDDAPITAANISVAKNWADQLGRVLRSKDAGASEQSDLQDNLRHMITLMTSKHQFTTSSNGAGESYFEGTVQEMLTDIIAGTLAKDQNITETMLNNYNTTADELYVDRDAVMGVDLNDEAMNMMQYQKAYSAACRLMTTYDDMLERLINGMAV
jgi:flagellar hook-associated protein FlgK